MGRRGGRADLALRRTVGTWGGFKVAIQARCDRARFIVPVQQQEPRGLYLKLNCSEKIYKYLLSVIWKERYSFHCNLY